jgi:hypothetical protein
MAVCEWAKRIEEGQADQGGSRRGDAMVHVLCLRPSRVAQEGHELCVAYWGVYSGVFIGQLACARGGVFSSSA